MKLANLPHSDSDFAGDLSNSKSTTGYVILVNNNVLHWLSRQQAYVSHSSCAAEYIAMAELAEDLIWLSQLLTAIGIKYTKPICVWGDNEAQISLTTTLTNHRLRGVRVSYHLLKDEAKKGTFDIQWIDGKLNVADIFTKSLPHDRFISLRDLLVSPVIK